MARRGLARARRTPGRASAALALALAVGTAAACGDDDGDAGCPECGPYGDVLGALCDYLDRCPEARTGIAYRDRDECVEILAWAFTCRLEDEETGDVHHWRLEQRIPEVTEAQAEACAAWMEELSCDPSALENEGGEGAEPSPCAGLLVADDDGDAGGKAAGERCEDAYECLEGLTCEPGTVAPGTHYRTCAVCAPLPGAGEPCAGWAYPPCAEGLYCRWVAEATVCTPLVADGDVCDSSSACMSTFCNPRTSTCDPGGEEGDPCTALVDCRVGFCDPATSTCAPRRANGEACGADDACVYGNCDEPSGRCGLPTSSDCTDDDDCATSFCDAALRVCQPLKPNGVECGRANECASGLCDVYTLVCTDKKPPGASCSTSAECASGSCDEYETHVCVVPCESADDCAPGEFCSWRGRCGAPAPDGNACEDDEECQSGWCSPDEVCGHPPAVGDPCTSSEACYPFGFCSGGLCVERRGPAETCDGFEQCMEPFLCIEGRCRLMNLECRPATTGEMCAFLRVCDDLSYCDLYDDFTCKARGREGDPCSGSGTCLSGTFCDSGPTGLVCTAARGEGAACTSAEQCAEGLHCVEGPTYQSTCEPGPAGQPCDGDDAPCPDGYFCTTSEACAALRGVGESCSYWEPCAAGLNCDSSDGCQPQPVEGQECRTSDDPCAPAFYCDESSWPYVCRPDVGVGEECSGYSSGPECAATLYCDQSNGWPYLCQAQKAAGEPCSGDAECLGGACDSVAGCLEHAECVEPGATL